MLFDRIYASLEKLIRSSRMTLNWVCYMKISVIVPVYNVEKFLEKCLDSLINQTLCSTSCSGQAKAQDLPFSSL